MRLDALNWKLLIPALGLLLPLPLLALKTASMKLPSDFADSAVSLSVEGYGGANRGRFTVEGYTGEFTRIESRLAVFDPLVVSNRGSASFVMNGPDIDGSLDAECSFRQNVASAGVVTFDASKLAFVCEMTGPGTRLPGRLTLGEPRPEGLRQRLLAQATRRGLAEFGSQSIEIESVHQYSGSRVQAPTPVGYLLKIDSLVAGAVELTDVNPTVFLAEHLSGDDRLSILATAIAVSLLRDPANSSLGD